MNAVKIAMKLQDDDLTHGILYADYLASKNVGDDVSYNNSLQFQQKKKIETNYRIFRICFTLGQFPSPSFSLSSSSAVSSSHGMTASAVRYLLCLICFLYITQSQKQ